MKKKIERFLKYILHGIPIINIQKELVYLPESTILEAKKILITDGGSGIGFDIARKCIEHGGEVIIVGRNPQKLNESKDKLGIKCSVYQCNLVNQNELEDLIEYTNNNFINVLINNAGVSYHEASCFDVDFNGYQEQFDINLKPPYFLSTSFCKKLIENNMIGNVLNIISERGLYCDDLPYELTKCALIDFTKGLSQKVIKNEIRVNAIAPGVTATKMTGYKEDENLYNEYTCGRGIFLSSEIAQIAVFSISDYFDCISGEVLSCNQGNHLRSNYD